MVTKLSEPQIEDIMEFFKTGFLNFGNEGWWRDFIKKFLKTPGMFLFSKNIYQGSYYKYLSELELEDPFNNQIDDFHSIRMMFLGEKDEFKIQNF